MGSCSCFIVGICINFFFRLVPTLVSLVCSVCSLSALFLSSWFLASLCRFRIFSVYPTAHLARCLLAISAITLLFIFFCRLLFVCLSPSCAFGTGSLVPLFPTRLFACCIMGVVHMHVSFVCYCFSRVDMRLHNSERIGLPSGRVCFVKLYFSGPGSLQGIVADGPRIQRPGKP